MSTFQVHLVDSAKVVDRLTTGVCWVLARVNLTRSAVENEQVAESAEWYFVGAQVGINKKQMDKMKI